jgi:alkylhydroperoxidase/carboxymuconolactone decarboxylase family protein YurZ
MTTSKGGNTMANVAKHAPELSKQVTEIREKILVDGALSLKTKTLMMMLCDALLTHNDGVAGIANRARAMGATEAEIAETLSIAFLMGGLPAYVTGSNAFRD